MVEPIIGADKSRLAVVTAIRKAATECGVDDTQLSKAIAAMQLAPPGTLLTQMPSESLGEIIANWAEIVELARDDTFAIEV